MTNNQNTPTVQNLTDELNGLLNEAQDVDRGIDDTNEKARKDMDDIEKDVKGSVDKLDKIYSELNKVDEEAGNELDKLMLERSEDLAGKTE